MDGVGYRMMELSQRKLKEGVVKLEIKKFGRVLVGLHFSYFLFYQQIIIKLNQIFKGCSNRHTKKYQGPIKILQWYLSIQYT